MHFMYYFRDRFKVSSPQVARLLSILSNSGERVPAVELTIKSFVYKICYRQKIRCYKNGSRGRVFECYKVQIYA